MDKCIQTVFDPAKLLEIVQAVWNPYGYIVLSHNRAEVAEQVLQDASLEVA